MSYCFFHTEHRIIHPKYAAPSECFRECSKCPLYHYHQKLTKTRSDSDIEEQRPKPDPVHKYSLPHLHFHIHTQCQQQNPPEQFQEPTTVAKKQRTRSVSLSKITEDDTEGRVNPLDTVAPPQVKKSDDSLNNVVLPPSPAHPTGKPSAPNQQSVQTDPLPEPSPPPHHEIHEETCSPQHLSTSQPPSPKKQEPSSHVQDMENVGHQHPTSEIKGKQDVQGSTEDSPFDSGDVRDPYSPSENEDKQNDNTRKSPEGSPNSEIRRRHPTLEKMEKTDAKNDVRSSPDGSSSSFSDLKTMIAFIERRFQANPYTFLEKHYGGDRKRLRRIEVVVGIFLVFFVYQALASLLVTICEDEDFWNSLRNGEKVFVNVLHRLSLFALRIAVRIIAPVCSICQLHWIALRPFSTNNMFIKMKSTCCDEQEPGMEEDSLDDTDRSLNDFEGSLDRRLKSMWTTVLHAGLFPLLLLQLGAFTGVRDNIARAEVCTFDNSTLMDLPLDNFIHLCDCLSAFVIFLVMGIAKDCYCYENKIATYLLRFGVRGGNNLCREIRNRWLILDVYCYVMSVSFTVFTVLSITVGKAFTPEPSQDLDIGDLVSWYFWISNLSLLLFLGFTTHRYVKAAGVVGYGLAFIFVFAIKLKKVSVPPGSSTILLYTSLGVSVFNLLACLFGSRCRQFKRMAILRSRALFFLCLFCLLLLPVSGLVMLGREVVHFAHFVAVAQ